MHQIALDAAAWRSPDDVWTSLLHGLEAPNWHGRNSNALWDTLGERARYNLAPTECINGVQPPFEIVVSNASAIGPEIDRTLTDISETLNDIRAELGVDVSVKRL